MKHLSIGEVAAKSGVAVSAIRYYEDCGLLPTAHRLSNNRRCFGSETLEALQFITACRKNSMGVSAIRDIQNKLSGGSENCEGASAVLQQVIGEISLKIVELQNARKHLSKVATACNIQNCSTIANCNIESTMRTAVTA